MLLLTSIALAVTPMTNAEAEDGFESAFSLAMEYGGTPYSMCTANLIGPRTVLTAAHCVADFSERQFKNNVFGYFGSDVEDAHTVVEFSEVLAHPDYDPARNASQSELDIAVLVLDEPVSGIQPTWFRRAPLGDEDLGKELFSVGFGIKDAQSQRGSGKKRSGVMELTDYDEQFLITDTNGRDPQLCSGDSGGPQFELVGDQWQQVGVHSWADGYCLYSSGSQRTDIAAEWILGHFEDAEGTADVCHANGWYDDGVCDGFCDRFDFDCLDNGKLLFETESGMLGCSSAPGAAGAAGWLLVLGGLAAGRRRWS